ncbi:hypothetical protein QFC19_008658 [Naganishia cerealis]|uniref:Uncharacterized protein n=1 Tax=Naganishia cerealis TaxID=610337 RepID=A0ACC2UZV7_9TREE|nr:hypothetical protein QFC19_008658 [Naganishia cerealis]
MKNILAFTTFTLTALLVTAYPHELSMERYEKREQSASQFADSIKDCDTRFKFRLFGDEGDPVPDYDHVRRFKIGPKFHAATAILAQLWVFTLPEKLTVKQALIVHSILRQVKYKFTGTGTGMQGLGMAFALPFMQAMDHDIVAYKGPQGSLCARVVLSPDSDSSFLAVNGSRQEGKDLLAFGVIPAKDWVQDLYDTIIWDPAHQNGSIKLWPYIQEVKQFKNCLTPWCASREETYRLYNEEFDGTLLMEQPAAADKKWNDEDLVKVLDSCKDTPVFFTNISKAEEENPAWIVSRKDGTDRWVLDMVNSFDQKDRSESLTVAEIVQKVLPEYPELVFSKS